ncbi:hypothetical protein E2C01_026345 [Portunus trituberculatus]|uniref:Uncharacterized protein n=1 Tax=Portunus trituberculatus TaxID=210409 RepID=A0A5B7EIB2_PORTR|nr:hypothetical protein [Portunus trituberculatus]
MAWEWTVSLKIPPRDAAETRHRAGKEAESTKECARISISSQPASQPASQPVSQTSPALPMPTGPMPGSRVEGGMKEVGEKWKWEEEEGRKEQRGLGKEEGGERKALEQSWHENSKHVITLVES